MNDSKKIKTLILDDESNSSVLPVIRCLAIPDVIIYLASIKTSRDESTARHSKHVRNYFRIQEIGPEGKIGQINEIVKSEGIDFVLPVKESTFRMFTEFDKEKNPGFILPPLATKEVFNTVTDKWKLYNWLRDNNFYVPSTIRAANIAFDQLRYPSILKPSSGEGGVGIIELPDKQIAQKVFDRKTSDLNSYIWQEYIDGEDRDISAYVKKGKIIAYTMQKGIIKRHFAYAHGIEFIHDQQLLATAADIFRKLNWSGVAHLDFRYDNHSGKYYLVDFNPRFWGTLLGSLAVGVNFPLIMIRDGLMIPHSIPNYSDSNFYLSRVAMRVFIRNLLRNGKFLSLKNTSLPYVLSDIQPELMRFLHQNIKRLRHIFKRSNNSLNDKTR